MSFKQSSNAYGASDVNPGTSNRFGELISLYKRKYYQRKGGNPLLNALQTYYEPTFVTLKRFETVGPGAMAKGARALARKNVEAFNDKSSAPIITNAGGCGAMLVSYAHLLADDEQFAGRSHEFSARVRDISQQLQVSGLKEGAPLDEAKITYDASCHLIYGQHAGDAPLQMLRAIPELEFMPLEGSERCCGGAGVYNLMEPELSRAVLEEKLSHIKHTGAQVLATGNPGCQMQIGAGAQLGAVPLQVCHPVELLDESYRRAGFYEESDKK